jgi:hypothetical protein
MGHEIGDIKIRSLCGRTMSKAPTDDVFGRAVVLLSGEAFERSLGLPFTGSGSDLDKATKLLSEKLSGAALDEGCRVVAEAAMELASSRRFSELTFALAKALEEEVVLMPREILQTLRAADPERPAPVSQQASMSPRLEAHGGLHMAAVSTISHNDGSVTLYSYGKLIVSRGSRDEVERLSREILG